MRPLLRDSWIVFGSAFALFLATFGVHSNGLILGNDVVPYAVALTSGDPAGLWNPHHLLFHPIAGLITDMWCLATGSEPTVARALQGQTIVSALGGAAAVVVLFRFLTHVCRRATALLFAGIFALSSGTWLYASVGETYLPATAALAALLVHCAQVKLSMRAPNPVLIGAWLYVAVLFRQDSVLVVPALPFFLPWRIALVSISGSGLLAVGMYGFAWLLSGSQLGFATWLFGLAETGLWGEGLNITGFAVSPVMMLAALGFGTFYVQTMFFDTGGVVQWIQAASGLLAGVLLVSACLPRRPLNDKGRAVAVGLGVFVLVRFLFITWWQPSNLEYHAGTVLPVVLLVAVLGDPRIGPQARALRRTKLLVCLILVGVGNWFTLIGPNQSDEIARRSADAISSAGPGGMVVAIDTLQYYALLREEPRNVTLVDASQALLGSPEQIPAVRAAIARTLETGGAVFVVRDVVLPAFWRLAPPVPTEPLHALLDGYTSEPIADREDRVWAIQVKPPN